MYERLGLVRLGGDGAGVSIGMWDEICERDDRILGMKLGIVVAGLTALTMGFLSGTGANSTDTSEEKV